MTRVVQSRRSRKALTISCQADQDSWKAGWTLDAYDANDTSRGNRLKGIEYLMVQKKMSETLIQRSVELAMDNVEKGGKPFACIVVDRQSGEIVCEATNQVSSSGDVSAHAEITAIRELAAKGRRDLGGCDVYITAYPCPMCLGALYYAAPEHVYYAASREQESEHYEDGGRYMELATFYNEFAKPPSKQKLPSTQLSVEDPTAPFRLWTSRNNG